MLRPLEKIHWDRLRKLWIKAGLFAVPGSRGVHLYTLPRWGIPNAAAWVPPVGGGFLENLRAVEAAAEVVLQKPVKGEDRESGPVALTDPSASKKWPVLFEYLTATAYGDGTPRQRSSLLLFVEDGVYKGMCNDRDNSRCLWVASGSLLGVLDCLNASLGDPAAVWRADRKKEGDTAKRVRKNS